MSNLTTEDYKKIAQDARLKVLDMVYKAKSSHIGSNFSVIDILAVLFNKIDINDSKIILSAGWKAAAFYYFLAKAGYFPEEWLDTYNQEGSKLIGLTEPGVPGVLFAGGSMQMGIPAAVGLALSKKLKGHDDPIYCICSDGEMAGGMVWESALIAAHHKLNNLVLLVDNNRLQAMGPTDKILKVESLAEKFYAFGFYTWACNGHDYREIEEALTEPHDKPMVVLFNTVKGKDVAFMENNNLWHYKDIDDEHYNLAKLALKR